jgi:hypothetical protein
MSSLRGREEIAKFKALNSTAIVLKEQDVIEKNEKQEGLSMVTED